MPTNAAQTLHHLNTHPGLPAKMRTNPRLKRCLVDCMVIDRHTIFDVWQVPPYQRDGIDNKKVNEISVALSQSPTLKYGLLLVGCRCGTLYLVDGHHRKRAFGKTDLPSFRASVLFVRFDSEDEEVEAYREVQEQIKKSTPNDRLKVVAYTHAPLARIAEECNFVTFSKATAGSQRNLVTMSTVVQCWEWSKTNPPKPNNGGSVEDLAKSMTAEDAEKAIEFFGLCLDRFGVSFPSLWKAPNLALCLWLYRRLVWQEGIEDGRWSRLTRREFASGLSGIANGDYTDCLTNKKLSRDLDRNYIWGMLIHLFRQGVAQALNHRNLRVRHIEGYRAKKTGS